MNIDGINTGYVLDHIKAGKGFELYHLLGLDKADCTVAIIQRASSAKYGAKDIIKIDGDVDIDLDILGYFDDKITVNMIRDRVLFKKVHLKLPETKKYRCVYCDTVYKEKN